jgi:hypothetical protein
MGLATFTTIWREPTVLPLSFAMAACAWASSVISTKPKPRD